MDIDEIELRRLDLTVPLVFINLMRLRKASDVADHMGLTQSSISHSIKRLRDAFGDQLFLRTPKGMEPTAVACFFLFYKTNNSRRLSRQSA